MKTITLPCWILLGVIATAANGQVVTLNGRELEIGQPGSNQVTNPVIQSGGQHTFGGAAIGIGNSVSDSYGGSLAVGDENEIFGGLSAAFGAQNSVGAFNSVAIGTLNTLDGPTEESLLGASLVVGTGNSATFGGQGNLVSGSNNLIGSVANSLPANNTATLGLGLYNPGWPSATIVGQYNTEPSIAGGALFFAVGNGTSGAAGQRSNAVEVYSDGTVVLRKRQGDILMGEFGN
jgi:hypothetical protein